MNDQVAKKMSLDLTGKTVGGWRIEKYLNHGKSAVVFLSERSGQIAALKIFDPEIVNRYGKDAQLARIQRERALIGKTHPNLVSIFDGGEDDGLLFIAMEYFAGWNLEECLQLIPPEEVRSLIAQVAAAAKFLEDCSFAHRDIKPANIGISPDRKQAKLLDLGVIRPLDLSNITDAGAQHFFVGTLRYSPPELLFREEQQTLEGWRAITFYQLGAVLHDLLMRKQLFGDITEPYACLVRAVEREVPLVNCADGDSDLRLLAQNCLAKSPTQRLDTVKWSDFSQPRVADPMESARRKIAQHRVASAQATVESTRPEDMLDRQYFDLRTAIHSAIVNLNRTEDLPRYELQILQDFNPCLLRVIYQPSPRHGLAQVFCFFCKGAVLDPTSNHQELQVWACNAKGETVIPVTPPDAVPCFLLRGTLIEQDVRTHIQQWLFLSYAANLDLQNLTEELSWLDIGGAL